MAIPKGTKVRQKVFVITGEVVSGYSVDQNTGEIQVLVSWVGEDGTNHQSYFKENQLEVVEGE